MNQEWVNEVVERKVGLHAMRHRQLEAQRELRVVVEKCDHIKPDGVSAIDSGFMANVCRQCGWSDLCI